MRVLITGGSGYIGSHLAARLQADGQIVRVLDPRPVPPAIVEVLPYRVHLGSAATPSIAARAVRGTDAVVHLGWAFDGGAAGKVVCANLLSTVNLLEAGLREGIRRFVFVSTAVVYGPTGDRKATERDAPQPRRSTIGGPFYAATKLACEEYCARYRAQGLPATVLRLHAVFSPDRLGPFEGMIGAARRGDPLRPIAEAGGEYVHLEDTLDVLAICLADPRAEGETFNVAGTHTYSDVGLAELIAEQVGGCDVRPIDDPTQAMVSVGIERLRRTLGYTPRRGDFLRPMIEERLATSDE